MPKYEPLGLHLAGQDENEVVLPLTAIAVLVDGLPREATKPQFWANAPAHHASRRHSWLDNGYHAFLDRRSASVVFRRVQRANRDGSAWSDEELRACVEAYHRLVNVAPPGTANKTILRNEVLAGPLMGRTAGAYERRMQNITSVLTDLGLQVVPGYPPLRNLGSVKRRVVALVNEVWQRGSVLELPTEDTEASSTRVVAAMDRYEQNPELAPPVGNTEPTKSQVVIARYRRDLNVIGYVLAESQGRCEACNQPAPFLRGDGSPFLEVHHLLPIAQGGPDTCNNAAAVCPNCHRELHHGGNRNRLRQDLIRRIERLEDFGGVDDTSHPEEATGVIPPQLA